MQSNITTYTYTQATKEQRKLLQSILGLSRVDEFPYTLTDRRGKGCRESVDVESCITTSGTNEKLTFDEFLVFCFGPKEEKTYKAGDTYKGKTVILVGERVALLHKCYATEDYAVEDINKITKKELESLK